jgi:hypothetical protein
VLAGVSLAGCGGNGPSLVGAPGPEAGGHVQVDGHQFSSHRLAVCKELGRALVPHAPLATGAAYTTVADQVVSTQNVMGFRPARWRGLPGIHPLISCTWSSDEASDLNGLYVVKKGAGLRKPGTYIGKAVVDRSGRWTPDETIFFDAYD